MEIILFKKISSAATWKKKKLNTDEDFLRLMY